MKNISSKASQLLELLRSGNYTNQQFWFIQDILNLTPSRAWDDTMIRLQAAWCDEEARRIALGTHTGPDFEANNGRFWA
jgi:hypothetical protein